MAVIVTFTLKTDVTTYQALHSQLLAVAGQQDYSFTLATKRPVASPSSISGQPPKLFRASWAGRPAKA
jgi:hypothetical protein